MTARAQLPRRRLPREARREQLLDVAASLVLSGGVDAVTMEGLAAAAGVSKGLGYLYFENSQDLLLALLERETDKHNERVQRAMVAAGTFEEKIRAATGAWFETVSERGMLLGMLLRATEQTGRLERRRDAYYRAVEDYFGEMAASELGLPRPQAVAAAAILITGLSGALERWVQCGDSQEMLEETYVRLVMGGLKELASRNSARPGRLVQRPGARRNP